MNAHARHRRRALQWGVLFALVAPSGCQKKPAFHGIDVTGAEYGRDFRLTDPEGHERTLADFKGKAVMMFF